MQFMVEIDIALPAMKPLEREQLFAAERARGEELRATGAIVRIWRVADRPANVGIWRAHDADELDELDELERSPPFYPHITTRVTPLEPISSTTTSRPTRRRRHRQPTRQAGDHRPAAGRSSTPAALPLGRRLVGQP